MWVPKVESEIKTNVPAQRHFVAPKSFSCLMLISSVSQLINDVLLVIVTDQVYSRLIISIFPCYANSFMEFL